MINNFMQVDERDSTCGAIGGAIGGGIDLLKMFISWKNEETFFLKELGYE